MASSSRLNSINELARLPYFLIKDGRLVLREGVAGGKIIDFHSHLGWHYLFARPVDLWGKTQVRHFYPDKADIDLDRYSAFDFSAEKRRECQKETLRSAWSSAGWSATHTIPNILQEMDGLQVERSLVLAVDYPVFSRNTPEIFTAVGRTPESKRRLPVFASLHPFMPRLRKRLAQYVKEGIAGLKVHSAMQLFSPASRGAFRIYALAEEYRLPVLFHTGLSPLSPPWQRHFVRERDFAEAVKAFPRVDFILGHSGGATGAPWALDLARRHENVYLETSGQPPSAIASFIKHADTRRILYGSDWPYYPMVLPLAKTLLATEKDKKIRPLIFRENAVRLLARAV